MTVTVQMLNLALARARWSGPFDPQKAVDELNAALASQTPTPPVGEERIQKLISDLGNAAAFFSMDYNAAKERGEYLDHGLDSIIEPIVRNWLAVGPTSETGSIPAGARLNLDAERKHAALAEAQWWHYQTHDVELCQDSKCVLCRRMMKLETELAAIGVPEPPSSNDALAKNQSAPTVCPAGPVVEGELRLREALARRNEAKWWNERTVGASVRNTQLDARVSECEEEVRRARAALTNDPPPVGKPQDGQQSD